jgi:hypothetical protein
MRCASPLTDLRELWTTRPGFESWWGPEGFTTQVIDLEARAGRCLRGEMIVRARADRGALDDFARCARPLHRDRALQAPARSLA